MPFNSKTIGAVTAALVMLGIAASAVPAQARSSQRESPLPAGACSPTARSASRTGSGSTAAWSGRRPSAQLHRLRAAPSAGHRAARPVVFMFHGSTGTGEQFLRVSGWREQADATGLVAVFPTGLRYRVLDSGRLSTKWNSFSLA